MMLVWDQIATPQGGAAAGLLAAAAGARASALLYGIAGNYTKRYLTGVDSLTVATGSMIGATLVLLPMPSIDVARRPVSLHAWEAVIALGIACTGVAYLVYYHLVAVVGPARAMTVTFVIPVFGILGALFIGEQVSLANAGGCAVVAGGHRARNRVLKRCRWRRRGPRVARVATAGTLDVTCGTEPSSPQTDATRIEATGRPFPFAPGWENRF